MRKSITVRPIDLGQIEIESGKIQMTDPCYEPDLWCSHSVNAKVGKWNCKAFVGEVPGWGKRVVALEINHESTPKKKATILKAVCGVDSGQCGFFDADYYKKNQSDCEWENTKSWYRRVCNITCNDEKENCGTIENRGVVAESGLGDGAYDCYLGYNSKGEVTAMRLKFI